MSAQRQDNVQRISDSPLLEEVRNIADIKFREHLQDCEKKPDRIIRYFTPSHVIPPLTKHQRDNLPPLPASAILKDQSGLIKGYKMDKIAGFYRKRYRFAAAKLRSLGAQEPPSFEGVEQIAAFWMHYSDQALRATSFSRELKSFNEKIQKMTHRQLSRTYPHVLRFKPCRFELPLDEDINYWAKRVSKYLLEKCKRKSLVIFIDCFGFSDGKSNCLMFHRLSFRGVKEPEREEIASLEKEVESLNENRFDFKKYFEQKIQSIENMQNGDDDDFAYEGT